MIRRPFFTYFGGKWRAAKKYPIPTHDTIIEPFAGSAGYALRYPNKKVILIEKNEKVAGLWEYLIKVDAAEILSLPDIGPDQTVDDLNICQEAKWLIGFWLGKGRSQPGKSPSAWMRSPESSVGNFWGDKTRRDIAAQVDTISHWKIIQGEYWDAPNIQATWYIDPPYIVAGKTYRHGPDSINYGHLGAWCMTRNGQVIVCENEGADWLPFEYFAEIQGAPGKVRTGVSNEVIWAKDNGILPEWLQVM